MFAFLIMYFSVASAASVWDVFHSMRLGDKPIIVARKMTASSILYEQIRHDQSHGMAHGLFSRPGLLAMMNRHKVPHHLSSDLPKKGPAFFRFKKGSYRGVILFSNQGLKAAILAVPKNVIAPSRDPFSSQRLYRLKKKIAKLKQKCESFLPIDKDSYGNVFAWSAKKCSHGGSMKVELRPGKPHGMYILLHP